MKVKRAKPRNASSLSLLAMTVKKNELIKNRLLRRCATRKDFMKPGYVYIMTNKNNTTLYVGVTSDLERRVKEHKRKKYPKSFTARYNLNKLVYHEAHQMIGDAIAREKQLKAGNRAKKIALIEGINPEWQDLIIGDE